jgi:hypothetical protein
VRDGEIGAISPDSSSYMIDYGRFPAVSGFLLTQKGATIALAEKMPLAGQDFVPTSSGLKSMM